MCSAPILLDGRLLWMSFQITPPRLLTSRRRAGLSPHPCAAWHWMSGHGAGNTIYFLWPATCPGTRTSLRMPCPAGNNVIRQSGPSTTRWPERSSNTGRLRMWTCKRQRRTTICQCSSQFVRPHRVNALTQNWECLYGYAYPLTVVA